MSAIGEFDPSVNATYIPKVILLTGGAGFIGSNVLVTLSLKYPHYKFICLDRLDPCASTKNFDEIKNSPNFTFVQGDICSADLVRYILIQHQVDTIMHFAAQSHVDHSFGNSVGFTDSNVKGTHVLLESVRSLHPQIRRFIHVSTDEVYGEQQVHDNRQTETSVLNPSNPYAATKCAAEFIVKSYRTSFHIPTIITRGNNVYGQRQFPEKLIPKFILLLAQDSPCTLHGSGKHRRSFLHVDDVVRGFDTLLHRGVTGEIYNIGNDQEFENIEILRKLLSIFRKSYPHLLSNPNDSAYITFVRDRAFNDFRYHIDSRSLENLGWRRQQVDIDRGLESTVAWYLSRPNYYPNLGMVLIPHPVQPGTVEVSASPAIQPKQSPASDYDSSSPTPNSAKDWPEQKQAASTFIANGPSLRWLIYGASTFLGVEVVAALSKARPNDKILFSHDSIQSIGEIEDEIKNIRPDRVLSTFGSASALKSNVHNNLFAPTVLLQLCKQYHIHYTFVSCAGASEERTVMDFTEQLFGFMSCNSALSVRVATPFSALPASASQPQNYLQQLVAGKAAESTRLCVLNEMLPVMLELSAMRETGVLDLVNPSSITAQEAAALVSASGIAVSHAYPKVEPKDEKQELEPRLTSFAAQVHNASDAVKAALKQAKQ